MGPLMHGGGGGGGGGGQWRRLALGDNKLMNKVSIH